MVPLRIIYSGTDYRDRIDISPDEVYSRMPEEIPTTSLPSPSDIVSVIDEIREKGFTHVIALHISGGLSGTINMVRNVTSHVKDLVVEVVDSKTLSMGLGFLVLETAQAIKEKSSFLQVSEMARTAAKKVNAFYVLETLEYLKKGGRIGKVAGTIGDLLNVKPIISVDEEGKYFTFAKVRGRQKSLDKLFDIVKDRVSTGLCRVAVMGGGAAREAHDLAERIRSLPNIKEIMTGQISPALGVHTGPGLVGVAIQVEN